MAATKSTKKSKTARKTSVSKTSKPASAKKTTRATKSSTKAKTKAKTGTTAKAVAKKKSGSSKKSPVNTFLAGVVKQATKVQKKAQAETKVWIKKLNAQDKQLSQLSKKIMKAKGRTRTSLDKKITKLQGQMSDTRTALLASENSVDKVATLIEWVTQLNAKPSTGAYISSSPQITARPTLVASSSGRHKSSSAQSAPYEEEEEYPEENEEEMNFMFGEDEDEEANR